MMRFLFSDRYRRSKLTLSLLMILGLCLFSWITGPKQHFYYADCLAAPEQCDGKSVSAEVGRISATTRTGFTIITQGQETVVHGRPADIQPGKYIDVVGIFHKPGYLELNAYHIHRERVIKVTVSLLPLAIMGLLVYKYFYA